MTAWYDTKDADCAPALQEKFDRIHEHSKLRVDIDRFHCSLYYDRAYQGFTDEVPIEQLLERAFSENRLNENVILRIVSTQCARFAKQRTTPKVITEMGSWELQRRADKYDRFLKGAFEECKVYDRQRLSDTHDTICGTGILGVEEFANKPKVSAVPPWELFVDPVDARAMEPSEMYRRRVIPRARLIRKMPKKRKLIESLSPVSSGDAFDAFGVYDADAVEVVIGWHLPSDPESNDTDGRVAVISNGTLLSAGEWRRPRFPFAFSRYMLPPDGFWGIGVVQQLVGMQIELNRTMRQRQLSLEMMSAPFVAVERGSKIVRSYINNLIGRILEYTGTPPQVVAPGVISPEQFQHGDRVKSSMFQNAGVSELAAASMKPAGLDSGKALRTYSDMIDDALHDAMLRRDQQILDLSEILLDEFESISDSNGGEYKSKYVGPFGIETISFKEIQNDRDSVVLRVQSTSALSTTVSGRISDVEDLQGIGVQFGPDELENLLNIPDLSESRERRYSMRNLLMQLLTVEMLEHGKYMAPEPRWNLDLALELVGQVILRAQMSKAPDDRIELLRKFELECLATQNLQNPSGSTDSPAPAAPESGTMTGIEPELAGMPLEMQPTPEAQGVIPEAPPAPIVGGAMPTDGMQ